MSVQVLIPTQRIHQQQPPQPNAHASSSRTVVGGGGVSSNATASSSSSSSHPHPHSHHHHDHASHDDDDSGSDVEVVIEVEERSAKAGGRLNKGKGRSSLPSTPSSSSNRKFMCTFDPSECTKSFTKRARLEEHILTHTGERPHSCPHCSLSFTRPTHLQAHIRTHLPESDKPFECSKEGCGKRFWTGQHLRRHEEGCGGGRYQCPLCPSSFSLSHQLRSHHAADHSPPGTKPFPCPELNCDKSFPTSQKLRQHAKMHDETRYLCTHPSHPSSGLSFPTWSLLRAHVSSAHPPSCPYEECKGRPAFKTRKGLKAHLKVHREREEDDRLLGKEEAEEEGERGRKRRRSFVVEDGEDEDEGEEGEGTGEKGGRKKVRRRSVSVAGKDWICEQGGCGKGFKSKKALKTHHQTIHLLLRPFLCPHQPNCTKTYGHNHLLQRHLLSSHSNPSANPNPSHPSDINASSHPSHHLNPDSDVDDARLLGELTGTTYVSERKIACPYGREGVLVSAGNRLLGGAGGSGLSGRGGGGGSGGDGGEEESCGYRFSRAYDLRRHLGKVHGVVVDEEEARGLAEGLRRGRK